jgi:oligoendopeptidase F
MDQMTWNIESEYPSLQSPQFKTDYDFIKNRIQELRQKIGNLPLNEPALIDAEAGTTVLGKKFIQDFQETILRIEETTIIFANVATYINCQISVNSLNSEAKKIKSEIEAIHSQINQMYAPLNLFITKCSAELFRYLIDHPQVRSYQFQWEKLRKSAVFVLSEKEEVLLKAMAIDGHQAWANLYDSITGNGKCVLHLDGKTQTVGIAQALAMKADHNEENRKAAWLGLNEFWTQNEEPAAAILNALAGWRITESEKRSHTAPRHFLDSSIESNCITRETLDAMMQACESNKIHLQKIFPLMSQKLGKTKMDPWDLYAPNPDAGSTTR